MFKEGDLKKPEKVKKDTLNFMIQKTLKSDVYELYLQGPNNIVKHGIACVPNLKCSLMLRDLFSDDTETVCVECKYNNKFKKSDLFKLLNDDNVSSSNKSENMRAFNLFLKKLENVKIEEFLQHIYPDDHNKNRERIKNRDLVEKLFFDRNGNFKISSISKLF